jgi:hypothetical protein
MFAVMWTAQPPNRERLAVVIVVSLYFRLATNFARLLRQLPEPPLFLHALAREKLWPFDGVLKASLGSLSFVLAKSIGAIGAHSVFAHPFCEAGSANEIAASSPVVGDLGYLFAFAAGGFHEQTISESR